MPYDVESYYLTWGGTLVDTEIWQCGVKFAPGSGEDISQGAYNTISLDDILNALTTWITGGAGGSQIGSTVKLAWCKLVVLDRNGDYKFDPRVAQKTTPVGSSVPSPYPPQIAYVVSLWSGQTLGRANHGRFYVPMPSMAVSGTTDGKMSATQATTARGAAKTMLETIAGEISTVGVETDLAIMSRVGLGTHKVVTQIGVGRALDTQRRRRNALTEDTVFAPINT